MHPTRAHRSLALALALALVACGPAPQPAAKPDAGARPGGTSGRTGGNGGAVTPPPAGGPKARAQSTFSLPAAPADALLVVGADRKPLPNATVTLGAEAIPVDAAGLAKFKADPAAQVLVQAPGHVPVRLTATLGQTALLTPIDGKRTALGAAAGGTAVNSDGTMKVTFSPGALTADAQIAVTRTYIEDNAALVTQSPEARATLAKLAPDSELMGGYTYHLDLGGAAIKPGASVSVDFKVEPKMTRFLDRMSKIPGFMDKGIYHDTFRKDAGGAWWFAMKVPGSGLISDHGANVVSNGGASMAAGAKPAAFKLQQACQTFDDVETTYVTDFRPAFRTESRDRVVSEIVRYQQQVVGTRAERRTEVRARDVVKETVVKKTRTVERRASYQYCSEMKITQEEYDRCVQEDVLTNNYDGQLGCAHIVDAFQRGLPVVVIHDPRVNWGACYYTLGQCADKQRVWYEEETYDEIQREIEKEWYTVDIWEYFPEITVRDVEQTVSRIETDQLQVPYLEPFMREVKRPAPSSTIRARVTYVSDDPTYNGRPGAGATVSFSHTGTSVRPATNVAVADAAGLASAIGAKDAPGTATAVANEPHVFSAAVGYLVNCSEVALSLFKYRPKVVFTPVLHGSGDGKPFDLKTTLGNVAMALSGTTTWTPSLVGSSQRVEVGGTVKGEDRWIDADGGATTIHWNGRHPVAVDVWISRPLKAEARWKSDDASLPAEQRPRTVWDGQPVKGASFTFAHPVSEAKSKPADRDVLSFPKVDVATAWGLAGAKGTVKVEKVMPGASFSGSAETTLDGRPATVAVNADLPRVKFKFTGDTGVGVYTLNYKLIAPGGGVTQRSVVIDFVKGPEATISLPVEDVLNEAQKHRFEIESFRSGFEFEARMAADKSMPKPIEAVVRGGTYDYPPLVGESIAAK